MNLLFLPDRRTEGHPDPAEVIDTTLNGITFRAGRRTAAHLAWTDDRLREKGKWVRISQPCYNTGVTASAGTHDGDGVVDCEVEGMAWEDAQSELRRLGWAAWFRPYTPGLWPAHVHMVSIGCPGPVGIYVPGQVSDYYAHLSGLKGHAPDPTWHPADIESTVFDYERWLDEQENAMPYINWPQADKDALARDVAKAILDAAKVDKAETVSVRQAINQIRNAVK